MSEQPELPRLGPDDRQAERWLAILRDGSPAEKAAARRGLAAIFEARGMTAEAIDLLVANARAGHRDVELFQALARLYRARGDEYLAASAALEAARLSGRRPEAAPASGRAPWAEDDGPVPPSSTRSEDRAHERASTRPDRATPEPATHSPWRRPARIVGWLAVVVTLLTALGVAQTSAVSAGLYVVSAAALGLLLCGSLSARGLVRLPAGPLGDGALLFAWLLLLLVAGAMLPRGSGFVGAFSQPAATDPTPSLYRTPQPATASPQPTSTVGR